jgi:L-alanine-DL-glutamate epimerase-like enolase superfamily enzyme
MHKVPVYDTTIYFDELDIEDDEEAVEFICKEVDFGLANSHRHFKLKIGRCGMWMDLDRGLKRDIDIVLAVRKRIGTEGKLMVDANNGYNCNLAKKFLDATRSANLFWLEEPFHEDNLVYTELRKWMNEENIHTLIADGESWPDEELLFALHQKKLLDVIQMDIHGWGFTKWRRTIKRAQEQNALISPHNWGYKLKTHYTASFAAGYPLVDAIEGVVDETEGVDFSGYALVNGNMFVPDQPGFGMRLIWGQEV